MKYLKLNKIDYYKQAFKLSNYVWEIVVNWDCFPKSTISIQFVKTIDSVSANITEGFGRRNKKDKMKFFRYSIRSQKELLGWIGKSKIRILLNSKQLQHIICELIILPKEINQLFQITSDKLKK